MKRVLYFLLYLLFLGVGVKLLGIGFSDVGIIRACGGLAMFYICFKFIDLVWED